jgi:hypothetical protein
MSIRDFTANVISATKVVPDGNYVNSAASGVWDITEQFDLVKGSNWPSTANPAPRSWFASGRDNSGITASIDTVAFATTGNATDFGDLTTGREKIGGTSSSTRGVFGGGANSGDQETMEYITLATTGSASDFGNFTNGRGSPDNNARAFASSTRAVFGPQDLEYITIASTGNSTDWGTYFDYFSVAAASSSTRGIFAAGQNGSTKYNVINYYTIASAGTQTDFGDTTVARAGSCGASNSTRAIFSGGESASAYTNVMDYITIASTGNATDFGNLLNNLGDAPASTASPTRLLVGGGGDYPTRYDVIQYVTIASTGNAQDFGDLTTQRAFSDGCSNAHGGL